MFLGRGYITTFEYTLVNIGARKGTGLGVHVAQSVFYLQFPYRLPSQEKPKAISEVFMQLPSRDNA